MAQFYTLEEAANRLAISPEDFKRRLKLEWTSIRPFRDGATLRFRAADIDELARSLGAASDPGLPLGPVGAPPAEEESSEFSLSTGHSDKGLNAKKPAEPTAAAGESFSFAPASDSGKGKAKPKGDSDVRLHASTPPAAADPEAAIPTEEIDLDVAASGPSPSSGKLSGKKSSGKLAGPGSGKIPSAANAPIENTDSSSEFELSLDSDSSDSFELQLTPDNSEEVDLGSLDGGPQSGKGGQSGINLGKPADSGVSLEKKGPKSGPIPAQDDSSEDDFELSLDPASASGSRLSGPKSKPKPPATDDSSSEFELTLDDDSGVAESLAASLESPSGEEHKGDIFETDFDLPALEDESGSEVVAVDNADTDLEGGFEVDADQLVVPDDDESASQVVLVDDDEAVVVTDDGDVVGVDELEQGESASGALRGLRAGGEEELAGVRTVEVPAAPPKWGALPVAVLFPTLLVAFLGMLMSFEILRSMWGYSSGSKPGTPLVRGVADTLGMKVND